MKSRKSLLSFEESKSLVYLLCDMMKIPVPAVRLSEGTGYEAAYNRLEIMLRRENTYEAVVHEMLHYVFDLIFLERVAKKEISDDDDDYEHRVVLFLEHYLAGLAKRIYTRALNKTRGKRI